MYRKVMEKLVEWKEEPTRKPLILNGARQVGKTCTRKRLAESYTNME